VFNPVDICLPNVNLNVPLNVPLNGWECQWVLLLCKYRKKNKITKYGIIKRKSLERRTKMFKVIVKEIESGFVHETLFVSFREAEAIERGYRNDDFYRVVISRY